MKKHTEYPAVVWILGVLLLSLTVIGPLAQNGFFISDDGDWMIIRLSAFYQSLREGQFPVRFLGRLNFSYGYPVSNFLYPGFLYVGSLLHGLGFGFVDSVKMILAVSVMGATVCVYAWLKRNFSSICAMCGAMNFLFAPYLAYDLYKRGSVGEVFAIFVVSMLFLFSEFGITMLLPLVVGLLIVSHNTLSLLFLVYYFVWILIEKRGSNVLPVLLGVGIAAFFWIPAIWERKYVVFDVTAVSNPFSYFASGSTLHLLGLIPAGAFIALLILWSKTHKQKRAVYYVIVFALVAFFSTPLSAPFWAIEPIARIIQFPYRLLAINLFIGSWLVALFASYLSGKSQKIVLMGILIIGFMTSASVAWKSTFIDKKEGFFTTNEATTTVANEYMPRWVKDLPSARPNQRVEIYQGSGTLEVYKATTQKINISVDAKEPLIVQINSIYYPGWGVTIDDAPAHINYKNTRGLIQVDVPFGKHKIIAEFRETVSRFLADSMSIISFLVYCVWIGKKWVRNT